VIPTLLALAGALSAGAAHARDPDVRWSVTIGSPMYAVPGPVYVEPQPVYVQPQPVYAVPVPYPYYRAPAYRVARHYAPTYWDRDGDGIPNRYDRVYNPPWDRDGDGIPNRHDRHPRDGSRP
jgi:hypothetical protein